MKVPDGQTPAGHFWYTNFRVLELRQQQEPLPAQACPWEHTQGRAEGRALNNSIVQVAVDPPPRPIFAPGMPHAEACVEDEYPSIRTDLTFETVRCLCPWSEVCACRCTLSKSIHECLFQNTCNSLGVCYTARPLVLPVFCSVLPVDIFCSNAHRCKVSGTEVNDIIKWQRFSTPHVQEAVFRITTA